MCPQEGWSWAGAQAAHSSSQEGDEVVEGGRLKALSDEEEERGGFRR